MALIIPIARYTWVNFLKFTNLCSSRAFGRWMHGTCMEAPPQTILGNDQPYVFTFHSEIANHPDVVELAQTILARARDTLTRIQRYFLRWVKHKPLWVVDKVYSMMLLLEYRNLTNISSQPLYKPIVISK